VKRQRFVSVSVFALALIAAFALRTAPARAQAGHSRPRRQRLTRCRRSRPISTTSRAATTPKHTPKITAPDKVKAGEWFDVTVEVGDEARHPSLVEHHVRSITIYKDDVEIARAYLHPVFSTPKVTFTIRLEQSAKLRAMEEPTHTAQWEASKNITVEK
jgi:superoxide reductase